MSTRRPEVSARWALAIVVAAVACGPSQLPPEGQFLVFVDTDAPLPSTAPEAEPALFDRVRIEIIAPGESAPCAACTRELAASRELVAAASASFGLVPAGQRAGHRVRVRLFRAAWLVNGEPPVATSLETVVALPPPPAEGLTRVTIPLDLRDVGRPRGTWDAPEAAIVGAPAARPLAEAARRSPCATPPEPAEACVPGGAFWMGDPAIATLDGTEFDGERPRVVSLSPFFVDLHEVTVAEYRSDAPPAAGDDPGVGGRCTYTTSPGPREDFPVTCVSFARAKAYCESRGRSLLTEAQFEYLAGGLAGLPYTWGNDDPQCNDAVYGRDPAGTERTKACLASGSGPARGGAAARDRLSLEGGEVVDLNGNVSEWVLDAWQPETGPCWGSGLLRDPLCEAAGTEQSVRGGSWALFDILTRAQLRAHLARATRPAGGTGFRCARR